jgi:hypothetical protein
MTQRILFVFLLLGLAAGCSSDEGTGPTPTPQEDWAFPASSTKFSFTAYTADSVYAVGTAFDVKLVLYNVNEVFGLSAEVAFTPSTVDVVEVLTGPHFSPAGDILTVTQLETSTSKVSLGITFRRGTTTGKSGSGAVFKLKCRARTAGTASFLVTPGTFQILKADGTPVPNAGTLVLEGRTLTIR